MSNIVDSKRMRMESDGNWIDGSTERIEGERIREGVGIAKPLISILDLGKLLLQYSRDGDVSKVHELIIKGAPFNADWLGMTPLHYAAKRNSYEICEMLLRGGINKDAKTKVDKTALHFAVYEGNVKVVELLLSRDADVNVKDMLRMTALHWAIERGHQSIVHLLLKHGADISVVSKFGKTPISLATQTGQSDLLTDLEIAQQMQKNKLLLQTQENQFETTEAVNSIKMDKVNTPKFEISSLIDNEHISTNMNSSEISSCKYIRKGRVSTTGNTWKEDNGTEGASAASFIIGPDRKVVTNSVMEILRNHGISMLPIDEPQSNLLVSALEGGKKLILSEGGKLLLNNANRKSGNDNENLKRLPSKQSSLSSKSFRINKPSVILRPKSEVALKTNKNVKIITMDTFKKMYGSNFNDHLRKIVRTNTEKVAICQSERFSSNDSLDNQLEQGNVKNNINSGSCDELPANIIEICSESDQDEFMENQNHKIDANNLQISNSKSYTSESPALSITEMSRQMFELKKITFEIRQQFKHFQEQINDYRNRLEYLEKINK